MEIYLDNGKLSSIENFKDNYNHGERKLYHTNGQLYQVLFYKEGKLMDILSCFDGNGKSLDKGTLANGNGTINEYDMDGTLIKQVNYIDGKEKK